MSFLKKTVIGLGYFSMAGLGFYCTHLVNKQGMSDYYKIVTYCVTSAGLYMLSSHLLDAKYEDPDEKEEEETGPITAQSLMDSLKPALEKQIAASSKTKAKVEKTERKLTQLEEDSNKAGEQPTYEASQANPEEKLTNFQRILQSSSDSSAFKNLTDADFVELMNRFEELSDSEKAYVSQIYPTFMKFQKLEKQFQESFESDSAKAAYMDDIGVQLQKLGHEMVVKGASEETFYYSDGDPDNTLDATRYENCSSDAESEEDSQK